MAFKRDGQTREITVVVNSENVNNKFEVQFNGFEDSYAHEEMDNGNSILITEELQ